MKIRNCGGKYKDPFLSDIVLDTFGMHWLSTTFPAMSKKTRGVAIDQLDSVFYVKKGSAPVTAYILALAVLFETANEALAALNTSQAQTVPPRRHHSSSYYARLGDDNLRNAYVRNGGNHTAVAAEIGRRQSSVQNRLNTLGLPNLADRRGGVRAFTTAFLIEGKSLSESRAASGIDEQTMDSVLRTIGGSFAHVIKAIKKAALEEKVLVKRLGQLAP